MAATILVVDDDKVLRESLKKSLSQEGFSVLTAPNGAEGLLVAQDAKPDLILTDGEMPGLGGHDLCKALRKDKATGHIALIIMTGALLEEEDIAAGLDAGADDYVMKPFTHRVMLARIRAVLRRFERAPAVENKLKQQGIELDPAAREVRVGGKPLPLTRKEFDLLTLLLERAGQVVSHNVLLESVWGYDVADYNDPHTVETHVSRLRKKLGPKLSRQIVNVMGHGYKFEHR